MSGPWLVAFVALWILVVILGVVVLALVRQVGILHVRLRPAGAQPAGEGPAVGERLPIAPVTLAGPLPPGRALLLFTSPSCAICAELQPAVAAFDRQYDDVAVHRVPYEGARETADLVGGAAFFRALDVRSTPYAVTLDAAGRVTGKGIVNSLEQIEVLVARAAGVAGAGSV